MIAYAIKRLAQSLVVLLIVAVIIFIMFHLLPGSPASAELGVKAQPASVAAFNRINGFNRPLWYQFGHYVNQLLHGNLGFSYVQNASVAQLFKQRFPKTILLLGMSTIVSVVVAIPLGIFQAVRRNSVADYVVTGASFVFYSFPTFWLGIILIEIFAISTHLLPPSAPEGTSVWSIIENWKGMVLPVSTLSFVSIAAYSRYMRSAMIDSLAQDFIRTARAKGLRPRTVLFRHALRNSLIPMATLIGLSVPYVLGGAVITESVFNYPGVGLLFVQSAQSEDFSVLLGLTMVAAIGVVIGNLVADLGYAVLDPRIRYSS